MDVKELFEKNRYDLSDLRFVFSCLRGENGCPWDRIQTHESIRANLIEETYEVVEAIDKADLKLMREELGDLLLQVVFHAGIEEENGSFTLDDVISDITDKLLRRHPHVFGTVEADDPEGALNAWEAAKGEEKTERKTVVDKMNAVPPSLPALMRSQKVVKKAVKGGYDDATLIASSAKAVRELAVLMEKESVSPDELSHCLGDALLGTCALAEKAGLDAEFELTQKNDSFIKTYEEV